MPAPRNYVRGYSFAGYQATNPNRPLPGPSLDNELEEIEQSLTETISGLNDIRRADGQLRNGIVGLDALAPDLATGVRPATLWQAGIQYQVQDTVSYLASFYRCTIGHLSVDFLTDLTATRWELYADIGGIATDAQIARNEAVAAAAAAVPAGANAVAGSNNVTALYDLFDDRYLGEKTTLPTLDNDGNALVDGALVSLTGQTPSSLNGMYVRRSGVWQPAVAGFQGLLLGYRYVATAAQTVITGADANGATLAYTPGALMVTVNGVTLAPNTYTATDGTSVVLGTALSASDAVVVYSFGSFSVADTWTKIEAETRYAQLLADVATTTNIALTDVQNFDGQTGAAGRVVLVTGQSTQSANGLYIMATGAWSRAAEMSVGGAFASGREVYVRAGIANFGLWRLVTPSPFTLGTSNVNFVREEASPDQIRDAARTPVFIDADANATAFVIDARSSDQQARTVIVRDNTGANVRGDILFTTALGWLFRTGASLVNRFRVNDSAAPAVEVFGSADVSDEVTGVPWKTWTTTVTPFSGSFTTLGTVTARYQRYGKTVFCRVQIPITTNGTAAGRIDFTLPFTAATSFTGCGVDATTGNQLSIRQVTGTTAGIARYDNVYPGANGANLVVSFFYETV
jgi:hypothetical protein